MPDQTSTAARGLEGVVAAESAMSFIDGVKGVLEYVGIPIAELASNSSFEETVFLLWNVRLPLRDELDAFRTEVRSRYGLPPGIVEWLKSLPTNAPPMHVLRTAVSALALYDETPDDIALPAVHAKGVNLLARMPTIVAAFDRCRKGRPIIAPDPSLDVAANFLWMLNGSKPTPTMARALDVCLILHADHGLNASTFTGRVISSTLSDLYSAVTGAIGALKGPLHGGANEEVMYMLNEIGSIDRVDAYIKGKLDRKERVMGFGHRVYKVRDPRAMFLRNFAKDLAAQTGNQKLYEMSRRIEDIMEESVGAKGIHPNVDFYSATTYHCIGLDLDLFTPMFALSRISGWTGHIIEQLKANRLIRPKADYTGPHNAPYIPIAQRKKPA